jgi:hypothetical protein
MEIPGVNITNKEVEALFPGAIQQFIKYCQDQTLGIGDVERPVPEGELVSNAFGDPLNEPLTLSETEGGFLLGDDGKLYWEGAVNGKEVFWNHLDETWEPLQESAIDRLPLQPGGKALYNKRGLKSMMNTHAWDRVTASVNGGDQNLSIKDKHVDLKLGERAQLVASNALALARQNHEAMNLGQTPDYIDPERRNKIEKGTHPYAKNPAFPKEPGEYSWPADPESHLKKGSVKSFAELLASDQYPAIVKKMSHYLGYTPTRQQVMRVLMGTQQAVAQVMSYEESHKEDLELLAVETVLSLPQFEQAKDAVMDGHLVIDAKLVSDVQMQTPVDPPESDVEVPEIKAELDAEADKRRMMNMMTQGAAVGSHYAFELADEALTKIDPNLKKLYGTIMSTAEFAYWAMPERVQRAMSASGDGAAGKAKIEQNGDQVIIHVEGLIFPVLIQEIVKGLMEYIAYDPEEEPEVHNYSREQTDTLGNEIWDVKFGPAVWRRVLDTIGHENQRWMPQVYQHLQSLPPGEFSQVVHGILQSDPKMRQWMADLIAQIKSENEEPPTGSEGGPSFEPPEPPSFESQTRGALKKIGKPKPRP